MESIEHLVTLVVRVVHPSVLFPVGDPRQCKLQLHVFSDASEIGYGASSYLRSEYTEGRVHCAFIIGKARNAPVKFVSIPRLELQAAVLATRMFKMLREELELNISRLIFGLIVK